MGFESRDYARTDDYSYAMRGHRMSIIGWIITINVIVFAVQCVWTRTVGMRNIPQGIPEAFAEDLAAVRVSVVDEWLSLDRRAVLSGQIWRLTTYDFLHSRDSIWHLVFNMYLLYLTGQKLLDVYTEREFLIFYLVAGVLSGIAFLLWGWVVGDNRPAIGASGAVCAVLVSYAMKWPDDRWYFFYVIPMKAIWLAGITAVMDLYPMLRELGGDRSGNVAHSAHVGGLLFGYLYARHHWYLEPWFDRVLAKNPLKRRPKLRIVRDSDRGPHPELFTDESKLQNRLDELLAKISEHGQASLSAAEQEELMQASRYFQKKR